MKYNKNGVSLGDIFNKTVKASTLIHLPHRHHNFTSDYIYSRTVPYLEYLWLHDCFLWIIEYMTIKIHYKGSLFWFSLFSESVWCFQGAYAQINVVSIWCCQCSMWGRCSLSITKSLQIVWPNVTTTLCLVPKLLLIAPDAVRCEANGYEVLLSFSSTASLERK